MNRLPDLLGEGLDVVFCGINPGKRAAATGHHFVGRGNRFWRALHLAGFTLEEIAPSDDHKLLDYRCGLTSVVERATARADALSVEEMVEAGERLRRKIERYAPRHIAFLGKSAYAALSGRRNIDWGPQSDIFGGAAVWILPNPSGRNRGFSLDALVDAYRELRSVAMTR